MVLIRSKPLHCKRQRDVAMFYAILERSGSFLAELFPTRDTPAGLTTDAVPELDEALATGEILVSEWVGEWQSVWWPR